jgi:hypothetical protein
MPTKRTGYDRALRKWFPKRYVRMMIRRTEIQNEKELREEVALSPADRYNLMSRHYFDMREWEEWLTSIEDKELIAKAVRMDLSLDDIPKPEAATDDDHMSGHWYTSDTETRTLHNDSRRALQKAVRERAPAYRKERREMYEFYSKIVLGIITALTGIGGTLIGIISVLKK